MSLEMGAIGNLLTSVSFVLLLLYNSVYSSGSRDVYIFRNVNGDPAESTGVGLSDVVPNELKEPYVEVRELNDSIADAKIHLNQGNGVDFGTCSMNDVKITSIESPLPDGVPLYSITVTNTCSECGLRDIHIACGQWSSAYPVDPAIFRRLSYNDCLFNNGESLGADQAKYFQYANSFPYSMNVRIATLAGCNAQL